MAFPEIPQHVADRVKRLFQSERRKKIAMELLFFDYWPTTKERKEIASRYDLEQTSIDKILYKLRDNDYFTKEQGSVPLYNARLVEQKGETGIEIPPSSEREQQIRDLQESDEKALEKQDSYESKVDLLELSFKTLKDELNDFTSEMRTTIKSLSAEAPKNNPTPAEDPVQETSTSENLVNPTPFSNMTGEQVYEMMLNQPREFRELMGMSRAATNGDIKAVPVTVRKIICNLTTYSLTCYEKAVNDGAFDGTLSDFINQCVYKYFEDRGLALGWHQVQPMRRMPQ